MTIENLKQGDYTVTWSDPDHDTLSAEIRVTATGVSCIKVTGGLCGSTTPPGINVTGLWAVFGTLKPVPPPANGFLSVTSVPAGASVDVNGTDIGKTPITRHELSTGSKLVTLRLSGYKPKELPVNIIADEIASLSAALTPLSPEEEGFLTITSTPSGASVSIAGVSIGTSPISSYGLPAGAKTVTISKEGYETATKDVTIVAGETSTVDVVLEEAVVPVGFEGWIEGQGGVAGMKGNLIAIGELTDGFLGIVDLGFTVTIMHMGSATDYYLGVA